MAIVEVPKSGAVSLPFHAAPAVFRKLPRLCSKSPARARNQPVSWHYSPLVAVGSSHASSDRQRCRAIAPR